MSTSNGCLHLLAVIPSACVSCAIVRGCAALPLGYLRTIYPTWPRCLLHAARALSRAGLIASSKSCYHDKLQNKARGRHIEEGKPR